MQLYHGGARQNSSFQFIFLPLHLLLLHHFLNVPLELLDSCGIDGAHLRTLATLSRRLSSRKRKEAEINIIDYQSKSSFNNFIHVLQSVFENKMFGNIGEM